MIIKWIVKEAVKVAAVKAGTSYVKGKVKKAPAEMGKKLKRKLAEAAGVEMPPEKKAVPLKERPRGFLEKLARIGNGEPEPIVPELIPEPTNAEIAAVLKNKAKGQFAKAASKATQSEPSKFIGNFLKKLEANGKQ